jgi:hypothetical protein
LSVQVIVSFENEIIKVIHANTRHGNLSIDKSFSFSSEEFDHYLATTTDNEFVVINDFHEMYQDIISLPPAKEKYLRSLVGIEIRKRITDWKDTSFFYITLRQTQREGKWLKDIFFFVVNNDDIDNLISRFSKHDKIITHLYPDVLVLSNIIEADDVETNQPLLGVIDLVTRKTMFLVKDKKLLFVRVAQSDQKGLNTADIESINMTIAHCRQTLRVNPVRVVFRDKPDTREPAVNPIVPVATMKYPSNITAFKETIEEYITPIAAALNEKALSSCDMLSEGYRGIFTQRKILAYAVIVFLIFSLMGVGYIGLKLFDISLTLKEINFLREGIGEKQPIIGDFTSTSNELQKLMVPITFMKQINTSPDMQRVLISLKTLNMQGADIGTITIRNDKEACLIAIEGHIKAQTYTDLQSNYQNVLDGLKKIKELETASQSLDLKMQNFKIELKWKTQ